MGNSLALSLGQRQALTLTLSPPSAPSIIVTVTVIAAFAVTAAIAVHFRETIVETAGM